MEDGEDESTPMELTSPQQEATSVDQSESQNVPESLNAEDKDQDSEMEDKTK
jgi:hypothetical protein